MTLSLPKLKSKGGFYSGKIIRLFQDLVLDFTESMLEEIQVQYNAGYSPEEIAEYTKRDPDEIFLALFHLAREGKEIRPLAKRVR